MNEQQDSLEILGTEIRSARKGQPRTSVAQRGGVSTKTLADLEHKRLVSIGARPIVRIAHGIGGISDSTVGRWLSLAGHEMLPIDQAALRAAVEEEQRSSPSTSRVVSFIRKVLDNTSPQGGRLAMMAICYSNAPRRPTESIVERAILDLLNSGASIALVVPHPNTNDLNFAPYRGRHQALFHEYESIYKSVCMFADHIRRTMAGDSDAYRRLRVFCPTASSLFLSRLSADKRSKTVFVKFNDWNRYSRQIFGSEDPNDYMLGQYMFSPSNRRRGFAELDRSSPDFTSLATGWAAYLDGVLRHWTGKEGFGHGELDSQPENFWRAYPTPLDLLHEP